MTQEAFSVIGARLDWSEKKPTVSELKAVAMLASGGYLTSVRHLEFVYKNITDIPPDQLKKLASIVTYHVGIDNLTPICKLGSILASVKCTELSLMNMGMSEADTQALVTAMRDRVEEVELWGGVTLDIEELTKYDGRGRCRKLRVYGFERSVLMLRRGGVGLAKVVDTRRRYKKMFRLWAEDAGWYVRQDDRDCFVIGKEKGCQTQLLSSDWDWVGTGIGDLDWGLGLGTGIGYWDWGLK